MANHRYWRLVCRSTGNSTAVVAVTDLEFRKTVGGSNSATGGTAIASNETLAASNAFDGSTLAVSAWQGNVVTNTAPNSVAWIGYDFGAGNPADILEVVIKGPTDALSGNSSAGYLPQSATLEWSDNGSQWTVASHFGPMTWATTGLSYTFLTTTPQARAILDKTARYNDAQIAGAVFKTGVRVQRDYKLRRTPYTGNFRVAGSTADSAVPVSRRVDLFEQASGIIVARQQSSAAGEFEFRDIAPGKYTVMGTDATGTLNSVVAAHVDAVAQ